MNVAARGCPVNSVTFTSATKPKILDYGASQLASQRLIFTPALVFHPFPQHPCRTGFFGVDGFGVAGGMGTSGMTRTGFRGDR